MTKAKSIRLELTIEEYGKLYKESTEGSFLRELLDRKSDAIAARENYKLAYKDTKASPEVRETARKEYLESRGIPFH